MRMQCGTCAGQYDTQFPDGTRYFHVCPPIATARIIRGGQAIDVAIADLRGTDTIQVRRGDQFINTTIATMQPDDQRFGDGSIPRPETRNENVDPKRARELSAIIAEGRGAVAVR